MGVLVAAVALATAAPATAAEPTVERVTVDSFDGVELGGWIIRPSNAAGKRLPTILISSPYLGQCVKASSGGAGPCWPTPETREDWATHPEPVEFLVQRGYAVAWFSVRGTGVSGGCLDDMGPRERRDQKVLVNWIARQSWSDGDVAMMGLSYMSATALAGAVTRPKALKTVVVAGVAHDLYTFMFTPQGLASPWAHLETPYTADISLAPPGAGTAETGVLADRATRHHERLCPEIADAMTQPTRDTVNASRDAQHWLDRRLNLRRIRASVFVAQGFQDLWQSGHMMQDDVMWSRIRSPKAMYLGQWGHSYPWQTGFAASAPRDDLRQEWLTMLEQWLDHHLKNGPKPRFFGRVRFEDEAGTWHDSKAWPPREADEQVLYLSPAQRLAGAPPAEETSFAFRSYPQVERTTAQEGFLCPALLDVAGEPGGQVFMTEPVRERTVVAGNPMAYLDLTSDQPGGGVQVLLHDVGPDFSCDADPARRRPAGARALSVGGADLRFHRGNFAADPFEGGHVRIDMANLAAVLEPGHRLALTVSYGDPAEFGEIGHLPRIGIAAGPRAGASQLVVPVLRGDFGGHEPAVTYPRRP